MGGRAKLAGRKKREAANNNNSLEKSSPSSRQLFLASSSRARFVDLGSALGLAFARDFKFQGSQPAGPAREGDLGSRQQQVDRRRSGGWRTIIMILIIIMDLAKPSRAGGRAAGRLAGWLAGRPLVAQLSLGPFVRLFGAIEPAGGD